MTGSGPQRRAPPGVQQAPIDVRHDRRMPEVANGDITLWYSERGDPAGPPVVLLHGLFLSRRTFERLAARLPSHRFLLLDLRGHGRSTRPREHAAYAWERMASDVAALLDHLDLEKAVIGGMSLGADVTLAFATRYPGRLQAAIVEMPVLEAGRPTADVVFGTLATALDAVGWAVRPLSSVSSRLRRARQPELAAFADVLSVEPRAGSAMLRTLLADHAVVRAGPAALAAGNVPTLVIGHRHDPMHPLADAQEVAATVPGARLEIVSSIAELRLRPDRYAEVVGGFLDRL